MADDGTTQDLPATAAGRVQAIVERVVANLQLDATVEMEEDDAAITARVEGEELGLLIGRRGQTIDALQLICYRAAFRGLKERKRVVVDAAGYRERQREILERQADQAAERALKRGRPMDLEPMTAQERRVIHDRLKDRAGVETYSEGDEPERFVVVAPLLSE
ncbi:MAG TPA: R3H domain-containing nucleic acid-binding protein [Solirubrobacterales bacterium]|nr:R3H domain-containing nucleic acid-binding protein [Solirubrobacterales bacterium]